MAGRRRGKLSPREREVLRLRSQRKPIDSIASDLKISKNTIDGYLQSAKQKLGAKNPKEAIRKAKEEGLLD